MFKKVLLGVLFILSYTLSFAQNSNTNTISVYLDCRNCSSFFIRSEINFISFVRDQADADIHLIITSEGTGSGGQQYNLEYIGLKKLSEISNSILYTSYNSDTQDEERNGLVKHIKLGLVPYLIETNSLSGFDLNYSGNSNITELSEQNDKWNNWIFEIGGNSFFSGEESQNRLNLNGRLRIRRTTDNWKVRLNGNLRYNIRRIKSIDDSTGVESTESFIIANENFSGLVARSLSDHWSVGSYFSLGSNSTRNTTFTAGASPTIEYSFYPYNEYARREVTLRYGMSPSFTNYSERTIFQKDDEFLVRQQLNLNMNYVKPWGEIEGSILALNYLNDFSKNRLEFDFEIDFRVFRGFEIFFSGYYAFINDQLFISANGETDKEALANTRQLETSFEYGGSIGFEITFGSIYDNVVNTRF